VLSGTRWRTGRWLHVLANLSPTKGSLALNRRLGGPNSPCGLFGGQKLTAPAEVIIPNSLAVKPIV